jgi:hypothetical protein
VRLTLELVSKRHDVPRGTPEPTGERDATGRAAWSLIEDAWRKATEVGISADERQRRQNWVGGALATYALFTGESATELRDRLQASRPVSAMQDTSILSQVPTFQEGRSTPPPPRHPGAQAPVE